MPATSATPQATPPAPGAPAAACRVAFLGLSDGERQSLSACFRQAAERQPGYTLVHTLTDAEFLVADADHAPSVQLVEVTERLAETVFIGARSPAGAAPAMRRPIDALQVMSALDGLPRAARPAAIPPAVAPPKPTPITAVQASPQPDAAPGASPEVGRLIVESMRRAPPVVVKADAQPARALRVPAPPPTPPATQAPSRPEPAPRSAPPASGARSSRPVFVGPPAPPRALLVDDSAIAVRYLTSRLLPWFVRCDTAESSEQALALLAEHRYDLLFLDLELGPDSSMDGLALCQHIKRLALAPGATLVMVSALHSELDRARGALAGCDAYLGKPLVGGELETLLRRHGAVPPASAQGVPAAPLR